MLGMFRLRRNSPELGKLSAILPLAYNRGNHGSSMDRWVLVATTGLFVALLAACLLPVSSDSTEDGGDGRAQVVIPRHVKTPPYRPRTWIFLIVTALLGVVFLGWQRPSLPAAYAGVVRAVATAITRDPASVNGYVARLRPA